jgi:hypothetical protein
VAVGLDLDGQYALRLDASGNDGSLPYSIADRKAAEDYSRAGATFKLKYAKRDVF